MQSFHSMLTEKIEQDRKQHEQYCLDIRQDLQHLQQNSQNALSDLNKFEENVLRITKNIIEPEFLRLETLSNHYQDYRQRLEQQLKQSLAETQTIDLELMLYNIKTDTQFQDILKLHQRQQKILQNLQSDLSRNRELLHQIQQISEQEQQNSSALRNDLLNIMPLLKQIQQQCRNNSSQAKSAEELSHQLGDGISLIQQLHQQCKKILWCLGIFGIFSMLSLLRDFI